MSRCAVASRPVTSQPQHVARAEHFGEERGRDVGEVAECGGVVGVDDERAGEPEPLADQHAELGVDGTRRGDRDADDPAGAGQVDEARHLEPGELQLRGDLHLGAVFQEVPAGNRGGEDQLVQPQYRRFAHMSMAPE